MSFRRRGLLPGLVAGVLAAGCVAPEEEPRRAHPTSTSAQSAPPARPAAPARQAPAPEHAAGNGRSLRGRLRAEKIGPVSFDAETGAIENVVTLIRTATDIPVIVTPAAREVIASEAIVVELEMKAPITVENLLDFVTSRSDHLSWRVRSGVVQIGARAEGGSDNVLVVYDVRDLVFPRTSFLPPVIRGIPGDDGFGGPPRAGGEAEDKVAAIEGDQLIENVRMATDPAYWESDPDAGIDYVDSGFLIVKACPEMHRRIRSFLGAGR